MQLYQENNCKKSSEKAYDVVVVGLGTSGSIALVAAARKGLKVLGVEERNAMGGTGTLGAVSNYYYGSSGGIYEDINRKTNEIQNELFSDFPSVRMDTKAYVLENEAVKAGAELMYDSTVIKVYMQGKKAVGLCVLCNGKEINIHSKIIIDATGEAYVCKLAGCETYCGREFDGQTQTYTNAAITFENGKLQNGMNIDSGFVNQNDCRDLSRAIVDSLSQYNDIYVNEYNNRTFITNASILGIREGRHILGEEQLKLDEFMLNDRTSEKPLFYAFSNLDSHCKDMVFENEIFNDLMVVCGLWGLLFSVGVPMGSVIPKGFDGILVAGRCLSCDHDFACCVRMKKDMEKCGEAVAMIAYLAIKNNCKTKDVSYDELVPLLKETGCLSEKNNIGLFQRALKFGDKIPCSFPRDINEIKNQLSGNSPGLAIWSVKRLGNKIADLLAEWLSSDNENLKKHTAFALALISDKRACKVLRQIVEERDGFIPSTSIKYTFTRCNTAIYLLGRIGDKDAVKTLCDIIQNNSFSDSSSFVPDEFYGSIEELQSQYVVYAVRALIDIAKQNPEVASEIRSNLNNLIISGDMSLNITLKSNPNIKHNLYEKIKNYISIYMVESNSK